MSTFSSVYDAIITRCQAVYSSKMRITNPYAISENPEQILSNGWGISIGPSTNTNRELTCKISIQSTFTLYLTKRSLSIELDVESRASIEKALKDDQLVFIQDLYQNTALPSVLDINAFVSDGGIETVFSGKDSFKLLSTNFTVEYFDNI